MQCLSECDKILVMKDGRVLESGTHQELMQSATDYANIINSYYRKLTGPSA